MGPRPCTLVDMTAVEVIYLVAAILWIGVVIGALAVGIHVALKLRAKRRRINRILAVVRIQRMWEPRAPAARQRRRRLATSGPHRRHRQRL
jgi:predicted nucleic acid-binding protein